jgi:hypothetical protein
MVLALSWWKSLNIQDGLTLLSEASVGMVGMAGWLDSAESMN